MGDYEFEITIHASEVMISFGGRSRTWSFISKEDAFKEVIQFAEKQNASEEEMAVVRSALENLK